MRWPLFTTSRCKTVEFIVITALPTLVEIFSLLRSNARQHAFIALAAILKDYFDFRYCIQGVSLDIWTYWRLVLKLCHFTCGNTYARHGFRARLSLIKPPPPAPHHFSRVVLLLYCRFLFSLGLIKFH